MDFTEADRATLQGIALHVARMDERLGEDDKGLCGTVKEHSKRIHTVEIILAAAGGAGLLTGGIAGASKLIGG
jgi:hypothetical protein